MANKEILGRAGSKPDDPRFACHVRGAWGDSATSLAFDRDQAANLGSGAYAMNAPTGERASEITALFADLYELTMLGAYGLLGMDASATFSLFVRELPASRNFLIACGLDDLLDELEGFRFHEQDISYLRSLNCFRKA